MPLAWWPPSPCCPAWFNLAPTPPSNSNPSPLALPPWPAPIFVYLPGCSWTPAQLPHPHVWPGLGLAFPPMPPHTHLALAPLFPPLCPAYLAPPPPHMPCLTPLCPGLVYCLVPPTCQACNTFPCLLPALVPVCGDCADLVPSYPPTQTLHYPHLATLPAYHHLPCPLPCNFITCGLPYALYAIPRHVLPAVWFPRRAWTFTFIVAFDLVLHYPLTPYPLRYDSYFEHAAASCPRTLPVLFYSGSEHSVTPYTPDLQFLGSDVGGFIYPTLLPTRGPYCYS